MTGDRVGSLAEEAAKLMAVLQTWGSHCAAPAEAAPDEAPPDPAPECRDCPVCRVRRAVAGVPPEVRAHFVSAGASLALGVQALLDGLDATSRRNGAGSSPSSQAAPSDGAAGAPGFGANGSSGVDPVED